MGIVSVHYNGYHITTDKTLMDTSAIHKWLSERSHWAIGMPFDTFKTSFDNSHCIGVLNDKEQVGFARITTDYATFGYLADVYIIEAHRGLGLSKAMMKALFAQEWVARCRRFLLATRDAHELYRASGFTELKYPERMMEILRTDIYNR